ncbi:MAG: preprotein translocase subunit YajC [Oscillospiraceae bacterium]|jgi:preprotein translocase subunit YajC|nr:preprotein translocase subunit YajC [Oscillospiraceae bacterium]
MNFYLLNLAAGGSAEGTTQGGGWQMIVLIVLMVGVMYFTMIRPQKKRQKEEQTMRDNIEVGDEITSIGGIMGRVVTVKEDSIVIETGADRARLRLIRTAVGINNTAQEKLEAERAAAKKAQEEARAEKLSTDAKERKKSKKDKET